MALTDDEKKDITDNIERVTELIKICDEQIKQTLASGAAEWENDSDLSRRRVKNIPISELRKTRQSYVHELAGLRRRLNGDNHLRTIKVRFDR